MDHKTQRRKHCLGRRRGPKQRKSSLPSARRSKAHPSNAPSEQYCHHTVEEVPLVYKFRSDPVFREKGTRTHTWDLGCKFCVILVWLRPGASHSLPVFETWITVGGCSLPGSHRWWLTASIARSGHPMNICTEFLFKLYVFQWKTEDFLVVILQTLCSEAPLKEPFNGCISSQNFTRAPKVLW